MDIGDNHAWVPFFTHTSRAFGVISLQDWVHELWPSNLLLKFAKHVVNASVIFIMSITPESPFWLLGCLTVQFHLSSLGPLDLWSLALFNALSLWQLGLVCPWSPQWWHTWFVLEPLCDFEGDFPLASDLTVDWLRGLFNTLWSTTFFFF